MSTLQEELIRDFGDGFNKRAEEMLNSSFLRNKDSWIKAAVEGYTRFSSNPNDTLSKIASDNQLNEEQVKRLVEETNVGIYLAKYAMTKGRQIRNVEFPLADTDKIKQLLGMSREASSEVAINQETEKEGAVRMTKSASAETMNFSVSEKTTGDCFTSSAPCDPILWEQNVPEKVAAVMLKNKIVSKLTEEKLAQEKRESNFVRNVSVLSNAIIHNERAGQSGQDLLERVSFDAGLSPTEQLPIIKYANMAMTWLKEARRLPQNFDLNLVPSEKKPEAFSLGRHSLSKIAQDVNVKIDRLPDNVTYEQLVDVAKEIKKEIDENPPKDTSQPITVKAKDVL